MPPHSARFYTDASHALKSPKAKRLPPAQGAPRAAPLRYRRQFSAGASSGLSRCSTQYLNSQRTYGGGPKFSKLGRAVVYRRADLDAWLASRAVETTAEADRLPPLPPIMPLHKRPGGRAGPPRPSPEGKDLAGIRNTRQRCFGRALTGCVSVTLKSERRHER